MNLANEIRFGPDVEWLKPPADLDEGNPDFWEKMLEPNESRHDEVFDAVKRYLPGVDRAEADLGSFTLVLIHTPIYKLSQF